MRDLHRQNITNIPSLLHGDILPIRPSLHQSDHATPIDPDLLRHSSRDTFATVHADRHHRTRPGTAVADYSRDDPEGRSSIDGVVDTWSGTRFLPTSDRSSRNNYSLRRWMQGRPLDHAMGGTPSDIHSSSLKIYEFCQWKAQRGGGLLVLVTNYVSPPTHC
jgi:hypothetical protein